MRVLVLSVLLACLVVAPTGTALLPSSVAPIVAPAATSSEPSGYDAVAAPGSHIVTHFRLTTIGHGEFLEVRNPDGDVALRLRVSGSRIQTFDGAAWRTLVSSVSSFWHRLDIQLEGATALVSIDHAVPRAVATLAHAEEGSAHFLPAPIVQGGPTRHDGARGIAMDAFANASHDGGWTLVGDPARLSLRPTSSIGYRSAGHLRALPAVAPAPSFLAVPVAGLGGTYVAEIAAAPDNVLVPSESVAVLAGLSGPLDAPTVEWSVHMARLPLRAGASDAEGIVNDAFSVAFVFRGADGTAAVLSDGWSSAGEFHHLRAVVDEPAGQIAFVADEASTATVVTPRGGLGGSAWIAVGDLGACVCDDARVAATLLDDLAVVDIP